TLARILQGAGLQVTTAASGHESLVLFQQHAFDLVYLDIRLPDLSGMDVLKHIHAVRPDLPVVLFTAQPDLQTALEALRHGAADYLLKPLHPNDFLQRTQTLLAHHALERRKRQLREQIASLQAELDRLEQNDSADTQTTLKSPPEKRYLQKTNITLDVYTQRVFCSEQEIELPLSAFNYLVVLMRHAPEVVDYLTLVTEAQGYQVDIREAQELAKWHIYQIRRSLESYKCSCLRIVNVRGIGYRLVTN
ncbi:MAG: response regulator transcription factor, partial [Anaerolineales bacterium]|nr:response regulator transcription factor [Anaerolineales bacterium]